MKWETVIGLEVHTQLATKSKIFSGSSTAFGAAPNTQACAVDLALPGTLPVMNRGAVERAIRFGLAVREKIAPLSIFARKNYFYPDLPKGYQISQYEIPVVQGGSLAIATAQGAKTDRLLMLLKAAGAMAVAGPAIVTRAAGPWSHIPRQLAQPSENLPSGVVWPGATPYSACRR